MIGYSSRFREWLSRDADNTFMVKRTRQWNKRREHLLVGTLGCRN
jgi:hypothetical protein